MQLRKMAVLATLGAATMLLAGCGDDDDTVTTCTDGSECGPEEPTCGADPTGATTDSLICLCNATSCGTDRRCDGNTGQCVDGDGTTPSGTCTGRGTCTSGICNFSTGNCEQAAACTTGSAAAGGCSYGQFCSGGTCAEVPAASCGNFTGSTHGTDWGVGDTGPVITDITFLSRETGSTFCQGLTRFRFQVTAYRTTGTFPTNDRDLESQLHAVNASGGEIPTLNTVQSLNVTNNGQNASFVINLCAGGTPQTFTAAMHFINGNELCRTGGP